jgi:prophage DNA circulation protein
VPAFVMAQLLYQNGARADELTARANPVHPAFMPLRFKALAF